MRCSLIMITIFHAALSFIGGIDFLPEITYIYQSHPFHWELWLSNMKYKKWHISRYSHLHWASVHTKNSGRTNCLLTSLILIAITMVEANRRQFENKIRLVQNTVSCYPDLLWFVRPGSWKTRLGLGNMTRYSAPILIRISTDNRGLPWFSRHWWTGSFHKLVATSSVKAAILTTLSFQYLVLISASYIIRRRISALTCLRIIYSVPPTHPQCPDNVLLSPSTFSIEFRKKSIRYHEFTWIHQSWLKFTVDDVGPILFTWINFNLETDE